MSIVPLSKEPQHFLTADLPLVEPCFSDEGIVCQKVSLDIFLKRVVDI